MAAYDLGNFTTFNYEIMPNYEKILKDDYIQVTRTTEKQPHMNKL